MSLTEQYPDLAPPPANEWSWWQNALKGKFGPFDPLAPQTGFYRFRPRKSDRGSPCAIWWAPGEDGEWRALVDGNEAEDIAHAWRWSHKYPISFELYEAVLSGILWPDEIAEAELGPATIGHNSRTPEEEVRDEIASADAAFAAWLAGIGGKITTEEHDERAAAFGNRFLDYRKRIEDAHRTAKAPALEECRRIDAAWITGDTSVKAFAQACKDRVAEALTPYRVERKRLADEAAAKAKAEADKLRAEAIARAGLTGSHQAPLPPTPPLRASPKASGLRKVESAVLDDPGAVAAYLVQIGNDEHADLLRKIALRMLKAGAAVPGARIHTEHKA